MINSYLSGQSEQEDHAIHLLFSANRWEAVYARVCLTGLPRTFAYWS